MAVGSITTTTLPSLTPSSPSINPKMIERAVQALFKWRENKSSAEKPKLLEQDDFFYLVLTLKRIPTNIRTNPFKIPIPNSLIDPEMSEVCLIIDDRPKSNLTKEAALKKIKGENIHVTKVLKLSKLRTNYVAFEAKRKLCDSYDVFLADKRVIPLLPRLLGKQFFKKKKLPVGVDLRHGNWKEQIDRVFGSALMYLRSGTCSVVKVGKVSMETKEVVENVVVAINGIAEVVPRKWGNVRSFHLKLLESLALPVYQVVPDVKLKIEGVREKEEEKVEEVKEESGNESGDMKKKKKKGSRKGKMREIRYMDTNLDDLVDDDDEDGRVENLGADEVSDDDSDEVSDDEEGEKESVGKKRKEIGAEVDEEKLTKKLAKAKKVGGSKEKKSGLSKLKKDDGIKPKKAGALVKSKDKVDVKKEKKTNKKDSATGELKRRSKSAA